MFSHVGLSVLRHKFCKCCHWFSPTFAFRGDALVGVPCLSAPTVAHASPELLWTQAGQVSLSSWTLLRSMDKSITPILPSAGQTQYASIIHTLKDRDSRGRKGTQKNNVNWGKWKHVEGSVTRRRSWLIANLISQKQLEKKINTWHHGSLNGI